MAKKKYIFNISIIKNIIIQHFDIFACLLFLLITLFLNFTWFKDGFMYGGGETQIPFFHPDYTAEKTQYLWWDNLGTGAIKQEWFAAKYFFSMCNYLYHLTNSTLFVERVFFGTVFLFAFVFMYFLAKEFTNNKTVSLFATLFYVFNPYVQSSVWHRFLFPIMALFALLPAFLFFYVKGVKTGKFYYAVLATFLSFIFGIVYMSPALTGTLLLPIILYFIWYIIENRKEKEKVQTSLVFSLFFLLLWLATNLWWVLPNFLTGTLLIEKEMDLQGYIGSIEGVSRAQPNTFTLRGMSPFYFFNEKAWGGIYGSVFFILMSWIDILVAFYGVLKGWKKHIWIRYFAIVALVGLFLAKGTNFPFGKLFYSLSFSLFPPSRLYRNPHEKLGLLVTFGYTLLYGYGVLALYAKIKKVKSTTFAWIFILITLTLSLIIYEWPMWLGKTINISLNKPAYIKIPDDYNQINDYFNQDKTGFRVLALPLMGHGIFQEWGNYSYNGGELSRDLFKVDVLGRSVDLIPYSPLFDSLSLSTDKEWFTQMLLILDVKYVFVRDDIDFVNLKLPDPKVINDNLKKQAGLLPVSSFGRLTLYKVNNWKDKKHIYVAGNSFFYNNFQDIFNQLSKWKINSVFIKKEGESIVNNIAFQQDGGPKIDYIKLNPQEYKVTVTDATGPFVLVLSETFHPEWKALVGGNEFSHFEVNGYANGFLIEKKGDYVLDVVFNAKSYVDQGIKAGKLLLLLSLFPLVFLMLKRPVIKGGRKG